MEDIFQNYHELIITGLAISIVLILMYFYLQASVKDDIFNSAILTPVEVERALKDNPKLSEFILQSTKPITRGMLSEELDRLYDAELLAEQKRVVVQP